MGTKLLALRAPRRSVAVVAVALLSVAGLIVSASPAHALTYTWWSGKVCHETVRTESGSSLSFSRTGQKAVGGYTSGTSRITVWYGTFYTQAWAGSAQLNSTTRNYAPGKFVVHFSGAVAGECSGTGYGQALGLTSGGMRAADPELPQLESDNIDGYELSASQGTETGTVVVSAEYDGYTARATFTEEQVDRGDASILIGDNNGNSVLVSYDPESSDRFTVASDTLLPTPKG